MFTIADEDILIHWMRFIRGHRQMTKPERNIDLKTI